MLTAQIVLAKCSVIVWTEKNNRVHISVRFQWAVSSSVPCSNWTYTRTHNRNILWNL